MRVLLVYPRFPKTFWSYEEILALIGRKALLPPLGLLTVAALLPDDWELRLVDRNVRPQSEDDWAWADLVMLSAMIVQKDDFLALIREARERGKPVVVGGPYPTSTPADARAAGADYLVLDEGEVTIPKFLAAIREAEHEARRLREEPLTFQADGEKPDVTTTPTPRFDLLQLDAYDTMSIQFSRGCPFLCEFCDIIVLYGRRPRTKTPAQVCAELDALYRLGWRSGVFLVDDNFIGNKRNAKAMLRELRLWQIEHGFPFALNTEASIDLAADKELLDLMAECGFDTVFIGIETPDEVSLANIRKHQNNRRPMLEAVHTIATAGMRIQAGFIVGFDGEERGAGDRVVSFIEESAIPTAMVSMLQALPRTALWTRLEREGRLRSDSGLNQTTLTNFVLTRPIEEVAREYVDTFCRIYEPVQYLDRVYRFFLDLGPPRFRRSRRLAGLTARQRLAAARETVTVVRAFFLVCWRQGIRRRTRWRFWHHLASIAFRNPRVWTHYLAVCAHNEHYLVYREIVRDEIARQVGVGNRSSAFRPMLDEAESIPNFSG